MSFAFSCENATLGKMVMMIRNMVCFIRKYFATAAVAYSSGLSSLSTKTFIGSTCYAFIC